MMIHYPKTSNTMNFKVNNWQISFHCLFLLISVCFTLFPRPWFKDRFMAPDIEAVHRLLVDQKVSFTVSQYLLFYYHQNKPRTQSIDLWCVTVNATDMNDTKKHEGIIRLLISNPRKHPRTPQQFVKLTLLFSKAFCFECKCLKHDF